MRITEINGNLVPISQDHEFGSIDGYVVDTSKEQLENYLTKQGASQHTINSLKESFRRIAIIRNLWVDDEHRGEGIGTELMESAIENAFANNAEAIVLIADTGEDNSQMGKTLEQWYSSMGFKTIGDAGGDPVMILIR